MATTKKTDELSSPVPMYRKLWSAKQQIGKVHKNAKNPHFKQSYADCVELGDHPLGMFLALTAVGLDPSILGTPTTDTDVA